MNIKKFYEKYYYLRDFYTLDSYIKVASTKIPLKTDCLETVQNLINWEIFKIDNKSEITLKLSKCDLANDYYKILINFNNTITITYSSNSSLKYAIQVLNDLIDREENYSLIPVCEIEDYASYPIRGIIEGYYGKPWTIENHLDMINFMEEYRLNTYMYAPKLDSYHRDKWYLPYPNEKLAEMKLLATKLREAGIDFYYCISPGHAPKGEKGFNYADEEDFSRLFRKLDQILSLGVTSFGLLLDDIDYTLQGEVLEKFSRPGLAHAYICNRVHQYLKSKVEDLHFVMCPTEYHQIGESVYRRDLRENLDDETFVFWTGDNVCAEVINNRQALATKEAFNKNLLLWDNFPVSDFTYGVRQYIGPIANRSSTLNEIIDGYIINPMEYYYISKISMVTQAHYAWNSLKYNPEQSFKLALELYGKDFYEVSIPYIIHNYPSVLSYGNIHFEKESVETNNVAEIKKYYLNLVKSVNDLLKLSLPVILELKPWLDRTLKEAKIVNKILDNDYRKVEVKNFYEEDIHFSGSELLDYLIIEKKIFTEEEVFELIKKRRGNPWYRVWEYKRK